MTARSILYAIHNGATGVDPDTLHTRAVTARLLTHTIPHTIVSFERWWVLSITGLTRYCPPASTTMPYRPPRRGASSRRYPRLLGQHLLFFPGLSSRAPASTVLPSLQRQLAAPPESSLLSSGFLHVAVVRIVSPRRRPPPPRPPFTCTASPPRLPPHHLPRLLHLLFPLFFLRRSSLCLLPLARGGRRLSTFYRHLPYLLLSRHLVGLPSRRFRRPAPASAPSFLLVHRDPPPLWGTRMLRRFPRPFLGFLSHQLVRSAPLSSPGSRQVLRSPPPLSIALSAIRPPRPLLYTFSVPPWSPPPSPPRRSRPRT